MLARAALLLLAFAASAASAQDSPEAPPADAGPPASERAWFGGAIGVASGGMGLAGHWTFVTGRHVVSLRSAASLNLLGETVGLFTGRDGGAVSDVALLYGRALVDTPEAFVSAGAGLGAVQRMQDEGPAALGIPLEVQAAARVTSWFGVVVYGFANVNRVRSFGGVALGLQAGRLW